MNDLSTNIEAHLLASGDWIAAAELERLFAVDEREFRNSGDKPGLLSVFAISGNKGFRHIERCTAEEWAAFSSRIRSHGIGELVRVRRLRLRRNKLTRADPPPVLFEKHGPQRVMFALTSS